MMNRREHLKGLFGMAAATAVPGAALAAKADKPVPPTGIGHRIKHISYSDQGGRPDGVQVMVNRKHVYVGHMFSDGVTVLDATDPRPNIGLDAKTADLYVTKEGLMFVSDWNAGMHVLEYKG